jgi:NAD(P)-dependent dehydrogenase (short-subunit alcohol dehydrogenase family)
MGSLTGRIAVVSGGASGIGQAIAKRLARDGASLEILDKNSAEGTCEEIAAAGGVATATLCDVSEESDVAAAVQSIGARHGKVDILVNNAGILSDRRPWLTRTREDLNRLMQVNYFGLYEVTTAIYPLLKKSACGRIIIIGSRTVFMGNPGLGGYIESKAAAMGVTRVLARELGGDGITVNAVAPGMIATPGTRANSAEEAFDRMTEIQAIKRRVAPEDVAGVVAFLASDDAALVTGQTIVCDGGGFLH